MSQAQRKSNLQDAPICPGCRARMTLATIVPVDDETDRRTYDCLRCHASEVFTITFVPPTSPRPEQRSP